MSQVPPRISLIILNMLLVILCSFTATATGKEYPSRPITIIVQYPTGGGVDVTSRALAHEIQGYLGQPVLVESRPGAAGIIAGDYVAKAKPDGHIIGVLTDTAITPEVYEHFRKAPYTSQDLRPVARFFVMPYALVSKKDAPWRNLPEFIKFAKDNPNKIRWGHMGVGQTYYFPYTALSKKNKLEMIPVPFKGGADFVTAILGGHVDVGIVSLTSAKGHVLAGKMKMLAVHHPTRVSCLPDMPTFKEQGYDLGLLPFYAGLFVPKATPEDVTKIIHDAVKRAVETPSLKSFATQMCVELYYGSASDLLSDIKEDGEVIGGLLKDIIKEGK